MPTLSGSIGRWGPTIFVKVMQSNQRVEALKKAGLKYSSPSIVLALVDTGASHSVLDLEVIRSLGLEPRGVASIHTPSSGPTYEQRQTFDCVLIVGETTDDPIARTFEVIGSELASQGFLALLGRDFLETFRFIYDGPSKSFSLQYDAPWKPTTFIANPSE
jgi:hypothetical protein